MVRLLFGAVAAAVVFTGTSLYASSTDDKIESAFKKTYVYEEYLKDDSIKVKSQNGAATLTGTVAEESHEGLARDTLASLPGVTNVNDQLKTKAEVAADTADDKLRRKVKMTLMIHRNVDAEATQIGVKSGVVTLTGKSASLAQKELTGEYAGDVDGVTTVKNNLKVATKRPSDRSVERTIDDASITAQVLGALLVHRSTSFIKTSVDTRNGKVTLSGDAKNAAEKALVSKLVTDIKGVKSLDNQMTVPKV